MCIDGTVCFGGNGLAIVAVSTRLGPCVLAECILLCVTAALLYCLAAVACAVFLPLCYVAATVGSSVAIHSRLCYVCTAYTHGHSDTSEVVCGSAGAGSSPLSAHVRVCVMRAPLLKLLPRV